MRRYNIGIRPPFFNYLDYGSAARHVGQKAINLKNPLAENLQKKSFFLFPPPLAKNADLKKKKISPIFFFFFLPTEIQCKLGSIEKYIFFGENFFIPADGGKKNTKMIFFFFPTF